MNFRVCVMTILALFATALGGCKVTVVDGGGGGGGGGGGSTFGDVYDACLISDDCNPLEQCYTVDLRSSVENTFGGLCTHGCGADVDCESRNSFTGACYALQDDAATFCFQRCDLDIDCYNANVCISVTRTDGVLDGICVPNNL